MLLNAFRYHDSLLHHRQSVECHLRVLLDENCHLLLVLLEIFISLEDGVFLNAFVHELVLLLYQLLLEKLLVLVVFIGDAGAVQIEGGLPCAAFSSPSLRILNL